MPNPSRGEVWLADFGIPVGHESGMKHPCLIISDNRLNHGPAELAIVLPITSVKKAIPSHFEINPPEGGLKYRSFIKCEDVRSISTERLIAVWGTVSLNTLSEVGYRLRVLMNLN